MKKRVETNLYKSEAIAIDIAGANAAANNATIAAGSAENTANAAFDRVSAEYGVCNSAANVKSKTVTVDHFTELYVGATCTVTFKNKNTADEPTLDVNGTGAKTIYARGSGLAAKSGYNWEPGATVEFVYDGVNWVMMPQSMQEAVNVLAGSNENAKTQIMFVENGKVYVNADHITTGTLDASNVTVTNIDASKITVGTLQGTRIAADAITATHLAADSVTADAIKANSVGASEIIAGSITGEEIAANAIESKHIVAGTIEAADIASNAITSAKLAANAVTADKISANAVTAAKIASSAITTDKISGSAVTVAKMSGTITNGDWKIDFTNGTMSIGTLSADDISSGTLTLGGSNNVEGVLSVKNSSGTRVGYWDNNGAYFGNIASNLNSPNLRITTAGAITSYANNSAGFYATMNAGGVKAGRSSGAYAQLSSGGELYITSGTYSTVGTGRYLSVYQNGDSTDGTGGISITSRNIALNGAEYAYAKTKSYIDAAASAYIAQYETLQFTGGPYFGHVTSSTKELIFFIPAYKSLKGRSLGTITKPTSFTVRTTKAGYMNSASGGIAASNLTVTGTLYANGIKISAVSSSAFTNVDNNTPVSVWINGTLSTYIS